MVSVSVVREGSRRVLRYSVGSVTTLSVERAARLAGMSVGELVSRTRPMINAQLAR